MDIFAGKFWMLKLSDIAVKVDGSNMFLILIELKGFDN